MSAVEVNNHSGDIFGQSYESWGADDDHKDADFDCVINLYDYAN